MENTYKARILLHLCVLLKNQLTLKEKEADIKLNPKKLNKELEKIKKKISWTKLQEIGVMLDRMKWEIYDTGEVYVGGVYDGRQMLFVHIVIDFIRPSWWEGKDIPYKEVSDKEAGII